MYVDLLNTRCYNSDPLPSSSRGLGRSPFKAETGVRISVGAQKIAARRLCAKTHYLSVGFHTTIARWLYGKTSYLVVKVLMKDRSNVS
jgi:hypothetical protein